MTQAQKISAMYDDDGQQWHRCDKPDREHIEILCEREASYVLLSKDLARYEFADGSTIVVARTGWDLGAAGCKKHCWAGVGCTCDTDD